MLGRGQPRGRLQTTLGALVLACAASLLFLSVRIAFQQGGSAPRVSDFGSLPPAPPPAPLVPDVLEWEGDRPPPSVSVLLWDYSTWAALDMPDRVPTPNYVGHEVIKDKCPVPCRLFHDRCARSPFARACPHASIASAGRTLQRLTASCSSR